MKSLDFYMSEALIEAQKGVGKTAPNPPVGAVVVDGSGEIVGRGFHPKAGSPHAEVFAVEDALKNGADLATCTLFVTLEPCNHVGRTPPCTELILSHKIPRVVVGAVDTNPKMKGKSLKYLTEQNVEMMPPLELGEEVRQGCLEVARGFLAVQKYGRPFITLKSATSLDGRIAVHNGQSAWITSEESRLHSHGERARHGAVLVGIGTILKDDPSLTARVPGRSQSVTRIVLDSNLRTPPTAKLFGSNDPVLIFCGPDVEGSRREALENVGATVISVGVRAFQEGVSMQGASSFQLDLTQILTQLVALNIFEVFVEGGSQILTSFYRENLFDRLLQFIAPKIIGADGLSAYGPFGYANMNEVKPLRSLKAINIGPDILIEMVR